jgi:LysR family glycine cleavage system transcriptional activator
VQPYLPPLNWLLAFEASARHLSFTLAASELNLTQAAISKRVKSLELYLRHRLFLRHPRSLELTKNGEAYLPKVRDAFERLAIGTREVFGRRSDEVLTVRSVVAFSVNWLAERLPEFLSSHPGKSIRITSSVWNDVDDRGMVDLDIQYGSGHWPGYTSHRLTRETIIPLCAPSLLRQTQRLRTAEDLQHHTLLHVLGDQEGWGTWLSAADAKSVDPGRGLQFDTSLMAYELAAHGGGVALGRTSLARKERMSGRLITPFELEVPVSEAFYLLEPTDGAEHPDAASFKSWLLSALPDPKA